jgi:hypothetical protein
VKRGTWPSWYAYCQCRDRVTAPFGFSMAAVEPAGRSFTVHEYSMAAPLRLAKSGRRKASPRLSEMTPPPLTAKGSFGSRQASEWVGSTTTQ